MFLLLVALLGLGLFLAIRELVGFQPQPEWRDVSSLRERLLLPVPPAPHPRMAGRAELVRFCLELRREFRVAWRLCRLLAPISGDPGYVSRLMMTNVRFTGTLALTVVCAAVGAKQACEDMSQRLREIGAGMRSAALIILDDAEIENGFFAA